VSRDTPLGPEVYYVALLFALFVVPKMFERLRLPSAVTSVGLGAVAGMGFGLFQHDTTVSMFSTLGIVSLFLFAGLDVDFDVLRRGAFVLAQHLAINVVLLAAATIAVQELLHLELRPALLTALALLTPSTGFILASLPALGLGAQERFWIKSKAITTELVALGALFLVLQSTTIVRFSVSTLALAALVLVLPLAFRGFAAVIVPRAPKSEFAFLLMVAMLSAFVTLKLGAYYLVGAFAAGLTAQRFRERLPAMTSEDMLHAVEVFASFFVPFYFFHAGLDLRRSDFGLASFALGGTFLATVVPLRALTVAVHRRLALREPIQDGLRIGVSMLPTLVFTLVIAQILRDRYAVPSSVFGGLIVYTLANTLIPGMALRMPLPDYETPHAPPLEAGVVRDHGRGERARGNRPR
jgi:Kef-type K+ transport system membrane component KefB